MIADEADAPPEGRLCACCKKPIKLGATRGKGGTHCSDAKCRKHLYGNDPKAARIAELEARLADKDTLIASQKHLITVLQQQLLRPRQKMVVVLDVECMADAETGTRRGFLIASRLSPCSSHPAARAHEVHSTDGYASRPFPRGSSRRYRDGEQHQTYGSVGLTQILKVTAMYFEPRGLAMGGGSRRRTIIVGVFSHGCGLSNSLQLGRDLFEGEGHSV